MIRPLLVGVSHGVDLMTLLAAVSLYSLEGEWNVIARTAGIEVTAALKVAGAIALACLVIWRIERWPWFHRVSLPVAVGAGLVGAGVNTAAIYILQGGFHVLP